MNGELQMKTQPTATNRGRFVLSLCMALFLAGPARAQETKFPINGATEKTPSYSQYFSWINNTNEGSTDRNTMVNLDFFRWLHDEYGMVLDIYVISAGAIDGPRRYGSMTE